jgi:hypothetical protein
MNNYTAAPIHVMHAPWSVGSRSSMASQVAAPLPRPKCNLSDVLPPRLVVMTTLFLYVSISTGFLTISNSVTRWVFTHPYVRVIIIFLLSFFIVDYNGPFILLSRCATAALITLIYQLIVGVAETPDVCDPECPHCKTV